MKKSFSWLLTLLAITLLAVQLHAAEEEGDGTAAFEDVDLEALFDEAVEEGGEADKGDDPATKAVKELIELGGGVQPIITSKTKGIETMLVVGASEIPRSLSGPKGRQIAMKRAHVEAIKHFLRFMSQDASLFETTGDEFIIAEEGSAIEDELSNSESSKTVAKGSEAFESTSKGMVRGLERIAFKVDGEGRTLYLAYGWSRENALGAEKLAETNKGGSSKSSLGGSGGSSKKAGSDLKDEETISKRAGKFFKD